jgi:hypothetical protein
LTGVSRIDGATALTQISSAASSSAGAWVSVATAASGGVGDHAGSGARLQSRPRRDIDDASANCTAGSVLGAGTNPGDRSLRAEKARPRVNAILGVEIRRADLGEGGHRETAGKMDGAPELRDRLIEALDRRLIRDVDARIAGSLV